MNLIEVQCPRLKQRHISHFFHPEKAVVTNPSPLRKSMMCVVCTLLMVDSAVSECFLCRSSVGHVRSVSESEGGLHPLFEVEDLPVSCGAMKVLRIHIQLIIIPLNYHLFHFKYTFRETLLLKAHLQVVQYPIITPWFTLWIASGSQSGKVRVPSDKGKWTFMNKSRLPPIEHWDRNHY